MPDVLARDPLEVASEYQTRPSMVVRGLDQLIGGAMRLPGRILESSEMMRTEGPYDPAATAELMGMLVSGTSPFVEGVPALGGFRRPGQKSFSQLLSRGREDDYMRALEQRAKGKEVLLAPAIRVGDRVIKGAPGDTHAGLTAYHFPRQNIEPDEGFWTSNGRYVTREEAADIARKPGQVTGNTFREAVWGPGAGMGTEDVGTWTGMPGSVPQPATPGYEDLSARARESAVLSEIARVLGGEPSEFARLKSKK